MNRRYFAIAGLAVALGLLVGQTGFAWESAVSSTHMVLEDVGYTTSEAAQAAWRPGERSQPVTLVTEGERRALEVFLPFATQADWPRSVHDRDVQLDLSRPGEFRMEVSVDVPEAVGSLTLYFRSGRGWYAGTATVPGKGIQTLRFRKADFRVEDQPTGWHHIDGIRISFWRGRAVDARARIYSLTAISHAIALVVPTAKEGREASELRTAEEVAQRFSRLLDDLGLGCDLWDDANPDREAWASKAVIILPYCPGLSPAATAALAEAVRGGSKIFINYQAPHELLKLLGLGNARWVGQQYAGQFAEVRFDRAILGDLPASMRQSSWNITDVRPLAADAQVVGWWYDASGKPTERAALAISPRGAFFSHILLDGDAENQRLMLAAVLCYLQPQLRTPILQGLLATVTRVGHLRDMAELSEWLSQQVPDQQAVPWQRFREAKQILDSLRNRQQGGRAVSLSSIQEVRSKLLEAYLLAQPSRSVEGRAYWNHSGLGAYPGDWERTARELSQAGFNMVLPNMLWAGLAHYESDLLPRSQSYDKYGNQIAQCVAACHKYGIEVHVWKVNYNLSTAPRAFVEQMRAQGRTQMTRRGEPSNWLCPSHPENQQLELATMLEVVKKYPVDGVHFDYIRYPGPENCYCPGCRERFEKQTGVQVKQWPEDCVSGDLQEKYRDWRCRQITQLVAAVSREARLIRPAIEISAAVFSEYPDCRNSVGQDWVSWVQAGYLDFICPMDYSEDDVRFERLVKRQMELIGGRIPMYPGIGAYRLEGPDRVVGQIAIARRNGAPGFTIFNLDEQSPKVVFPAVRMGATKERAVPPHRRQPKGQSSTP